MLSSASVVCSGLVFGLLPEEVRDRCLDGGERAAEVMRHGSQERTPDLLRLSIHLGLRGDPQQSITLQHEGELIAERSQDAALRGSERALPGAEQEQTDDPSADGERDPFRVLAP